MQFMVLGYDGNDDQALERRMAAREAHIARGEELRDAGHMLCGAALLDDDGKMIGSVILCDFASRKDLDQWLESEPYMTSGVWQKVEIKNCRVAPNLVGLKPLQV